MCCDWRRPTSMLLLSPCVSPYTLFLAVDRPLLGPPPSAALTATAWSTCSLLSAAKLVLLRLLGIIGNFNGWLPARLNRLLLLLWLGVDRCAAGCLHTDRKHSVS